MRQDPQAEKPKIKEYRTLGRTGFKVSDIGFGASYVSNANVLEVAMDMGVNYFDTAEHYGNGVSERTIGEAIKNRDRKSIFITSKLNLTFGKSDTVEDIRHRFGKCLERLQTDYVDCLMIHMAATPEQIKHEPFHQAADELKAEGRIKFIGLSNHGLEHRIYGNLDQPMEKVVMAAAEDGRFDVVLMVYNFLQKEQGEKVIEACRKKNMGVTLMKTNPVSEYSRRKSELEEREKQGRQIPERYAKLMEDFKIWVDQAEAFKKKYGLKSNEQVRDAAIKFCLSHPGVHSICPSMNTFDELETFVALSGKRLKSSDQSMLRDYGRTQGRLYCRHACGICEAACPYGVPVNTIMRYSHYFQAQGREKFAMLEYAGLDRANADRCSDCSGHCQDACPHDVPIQGLLTLAHQELTLV
jgi:predicted aldo/keto reductase-like oxidoreductase